MSAHDEIFAQIMIYFPQNMEAEGFVYLIRMKEDQSLIKIGSSKNTQQRVQILQIGNAKRMEVWGQYQCLNYKKLETCLHSLFSCFNVRGEWFWLPITYLFVLTKYFDIQIEESQNELTPKISYTPIDDKESIIVESNVVKESENCFVSTFNALLMQLKHLCEKDEGAEFYTFLAQCGPILKYYVGSNFALNKYRYAQIHHAQILCHSVLLQQDFNVCDLFQEKFFGFKKTPYFELFVKLPVEHMKKTCEVFSLFNKTIQDFDSFLPMPIFAENETQIVQLMKSCVDPNVYIQPNNKRRKYVPGALAVSALKKNLKQIWGTNLVMHRDQIKRKSFVTGYRYVKTGSIHDVSLRSYFSHYFKQYQTHSMALN